MHPHASETLNLDSVDNFYDGMIVSLMLRICVCMETVFYHEVTTLVKLNYICNASSLIHHCLCMLYVAVNNLPDSFPYKNKCLAHFACASYSYNLAVAHYMIPN